MYRGTWHGEHEDLPRPVKTAVYSPMKTAVYRPMETAVYPPLTTARVITTMHDGFAGRRIRL